MRIKTMFIILVTVLLTTFLVQNAGPVTFKFLWASFWVSKLLMMLVVAIVAFVLGILVGRPTRSGRLGGDYIDNTPGNLKSDTLSDEDRDYIS